MVKAAVHGVFFKAQTKLGISKIPLCMNVYNMYKNYGDASQIRCKYYAKYQRVGKKKSPFFAVHQNSAYIICIV